MLFDYVKLALSEDITTDIGGASQPIAAVLDIGLSSGLGLHAFRAS